MLYAVKITFHSAMHVDSRGTGAPEGADEFIRSDTLSAALCMACASLFPETVPALFDTPPFRVSSAFPFIGEESLFPVPAWRIWSACDESRRKSLKSVKWLSKKLFDLARTGECISPDTAEFFPGGIAFEANEARQVRNLLSSPPWVVTERQRVRVDRLGGNKDGDTFFFGLQFFRPMSGLWFIADLPPEGEQQFRAALELLGDTGIGSDRSSGLGHFKVTGIKQCSLEEEPKKAGSILLSLCNPAETDTIGEKIAHSAYGLTTRGGWISGNTVGRPPIRAFTEGSYFQGVLTGRIVNLLDEETKKRHGLTIPHNAPRDFRAVCLPCAQPKTAEEMQR